MPPKNKRREFAVEVVATYTVRERALVSVVAESPESAVRAVSANWSVYGWDFIDPPMVAQRELAAIDAKVKGS